MIEAFQGGLRVLEDREKPLEAGITLLLKVPVKKADPFSNAPVASEKIVDREYKPATVYLSSERS
ncbi:MAG: hypothetical protein ACP5XB_32515, partial [Isosphaeraceae bacterium]